MIKDNSVKSFVNGEQVRTRLSPDVEYFMMHIIFDLLLEFRKTHRKPSSSFFVKAIYYNIYKENSRRSDSEKLKVPSISTIKRRLKLASKEGYSVRTSSTLFRSLVEFKCNLQ